MRVTFRPATTADFAALYPEKIRWRTRAIAAECEGVLLGVGGIGYRPEGVVAFAQISDEGRRYPAAIHRAGRAAMRMMRDAGVPTVIAQAQPGNPAAERWLLRLGFVREGALFVWRRAADDRTVPAHR